MGNWYDDIDYALEEIIRTKLRPCLKNQDSCAISTKS